MSKCTYDPTKLKGAPIGMFHCPLCGCMVLAGIPHGPCDLECEQVDDNDRAIWKTVEEALANET